MSEPVVCPIPDHPLLADRPRVDAISDVMYAAIQKVLHPGLRPQTRAGARAGSGTERALPGGEAADDALQEALLGLLSYSPDKLTTTWEALGVTIAQNKAKQALRAATKGRRRIDPDAPDGQVREVSLVPLDARGQGGDAHEGPPLVDGLAATDDPEEQFIQIRQQLILRQLARELLDERERRIFFDVHFLGIPRAEVGQRFGLTGQRVGQIYRAVAQRLLNAAHNDSTFRLISDYMEGGPDD